MRTGSIYIIKNTVNDKVYIGQTTMTVQERFAAHMKPSTAKQRGSYKLYNAMNKYGKDKFYVETLETGIPVESLDDREIELIGQYDSFRNGYNSTSGGDGRIFNSIEDENRLLELARSGVKAAELAKQFGVNKATIFRTLHHLGFYYRPKHETLISMVESGLTNIEIGKMMNCDPDTVTRAFQRAGKRKHRVPMKNRTDFDYDALIQDYYNQMPMVKLCNKYGITKTTFYRIKEEKNFQTRPQIYKNKVWYRDNQGKCNDYGCNASRPEDELPVEAH